MKVEHYTYKNGAVLTDDGTQVLVLVPSNCSKKFRDMAGKELVNKLNSVYYSQELGRRQSEPPKIRVPRVGQEKS